MKYSRQRDLILETLRSLPVHPTAEELHAQIKPIMPSLSLGTVYRNLNLLVELGTIRRLDTAGSTSARYDGRHDEHCHLVCTICKSIIDMDLELFTQFDAAVANHTGFEVAEHEIVLKGVCAACAAQERS